MAVGQVREFPVPAGELLMQSAERAVADLDGEPPLLLSVQRVAEDRGQARFELPPRLSTYGTPMTRWLNRVCSARRRVDRTVQACSQCARAPDSAYVRQLNDERSATSMISSSTLSRVRTDAIRRISSIFFFVISDPFPGLPKRASSFG